MSGPCPRRVLQLSISGSGEVVTDNAKSIKIAPQESPAGSEPSHKSARGGCSQTPQDRQDGLGFFILGGLGSLYLSRRRRLLS